MFLNYLQRSLLHDHYYSNLKTGWETSVVRYRNIYYYVLKTITILHVLYYYFV